MKHLRKWLALLMCLFMLPVTAAADSQKLPLQAAHKVEIKHRSEQISGTDVHWWRIGTAQESVSAELNALTKAYVDEVLPTIGKLNYKDASRLDVNILHSRTGLTWMSFMVQSRYVLNQATRDVRFTTRTYDMSTGERVLLTDIFPEGSEAWTLMEEAVRERLSTYYPALEPDEAACKVACSRESIEQMDFTLHGMSLVLHLHAADFYPGKEQLIEVPLYYPEIRPMMTEKARAETDNLTYYDTVAITYDDGPNGWVTREMLNVLLETGTRATFFLVGSRMKRFEQYVLREHDEGHLVATHNYEHVYGNKVSAHRLKELAKKVDRVHLDILGITPSVARAPGGIWTPVAAAGFGLPLIQWTSQGQDVSGGSAGRETYNIYADVVGTAKNGGIILMHDMKQNSIAASEMIIRRMQERGYIFLTVEELFAKDGVVLQPDTPYWRCTDGVTTIE